jgi:hypothetical protein
MTTFSISTVMTARLRLRAFRAGVPVRCGDAGQPGPDAPSADWSL